MCPAALCWFWVSEQPKPGQEHRETVCAFVTYPCCHQCFSGIRLSIWVCCHLTACSSGPCREATATVSLGWPEGRRTTAPSPAQRREQTNNVHEFLTGHLFWKIGIENMYMHSTDRVPTLWHQLERLFKSFSANSRTSYSGESRIFQGAFHDWKTSLWNSKFI